MPHKKRAYRNHIRVKRILANSELSLLDKKKPKKGFERVPRRDYNSFDCKREELLLNDESDDDTHKKRSELKKHINKELQEQHQEQKFIIPKRSRKNKYYLMNHPELEGVITNLLKTNKRKYQCTKQERQEQNEPPKKKTSDESKSSICDALVSHMITSRFRYLNEKLYTSTSTEAQKMFQQDLQSFSAYHQGYQVIFIQNSLQKFFFNSLLRPAWFVGHINHWMRLLLTFVIVRPILLLLIWVVVMHVLLGHLNPHIRIFIVLI